MNSTTTPFDFTEFAQDIYRQISDAHPQPFLLPALYGGISDQTYDALFVLEAPSVSFTEKRWLSCSTPEEAIQIHRAIFFDWAFRGKQAHLFSSIYRTGSNYDSPAPTKITIVEFFSRFYVTDIWKDAAFKVRGKDQWYRDYWLSTLADELNKVPTQRIIFIGKEARQGLQFVRQGIPIHFVPFPSQWISEDDFKWHVARLMEEINSSI